MKAHLALALILMSPAGLRAYDLFHPVPDDQLRELSTDRPDRTESPYTVDAGHWQIESDLLAYSRFEGSNGLRAETLQAMAVNLKVGLTDHVDLQLVASPYVSFRAEDPSSGTQQQLSGRGDLTLRLKQNWWGNDGGKTAFGTISFLDWPTAPAGLGAGVAEGGIIFPLGLELPGGFGMGLQAELDVQHDAVGDGYHVVHAGSVTLSHALAGDLGFYTEYFAAQSQEAAAGLEATFDLGLTLGLGANAQLDAGINLGLTPETDRYNPFVGAAWRY